MPKQRTADRRAQIAELFAQGLNGRQIAVKLGISPMTVYTHRHHLKAATEAAQGVQVLPIAAMPATTKKLGRYHEIVTAVRGMRADQCVRIPYPATTDTPAKRHKWQASIRKACKEHGIAITARTDGDVLWVARNPQVK
jgi:hypothetical protein